MSKLFPGWRAAALLLLLAAASLTRSAAAPYITEFMASNKTTLPDRDGSYSDWVEIYNPDATAVSLNGWYLTDNASKKTKWQFPAVTIPAGGYLIVFADDKNLRDPASELHTNFSLSADGEYLGLIQPDGKTVVSEFAPTFPAQSADVSYGRDGTVAGSNAPVGYLRQPTPGAANSGLGLADVVQVAPTSRTFVDKLSVALTGARAGTVIRYELGAPSLDGVAIPEPTASSPAYSAPIELTASMTIRAAAFSTDGAAKGPIATAQFVRVSNDGSQRADTFTSKLPVVILDAHGSNALLGDTKSPAYFDLFTPGANGLTSLTNGPTVATPIGVNIRGYSSAFFPKKSYSVELHDDQGSNRPTSLLGMANASDWALVAPWGYDRSYMRNAFVYALSNQMGHWAPHTQFVEVFLKGSGDALTTGHYAGLAVLTERIKVAPDLVAISSIASADVTAPAVTGGYILKFDDKGDDEYGFTTDHGIPTGTNTSVDTMIVVATPKAEKMPQAQRDYIRGYVQDFENALFADRDSSWLTHRYLDYIDRASFVDLHLTQVLVGNLDGLERSAYFTKDRNGKLKAGPVWDFDRALSSADARGPGTNEWIGQPGTVDYWNSGWWTLLTRDPDFMQAWIDRWQQLRQKELSAANLTALADRIAAQIPEDAAARDVARWPDNRSRYGDSFLGEVQHLKEYLVLRADWIDSQFVAAPVADNSTDTTRVVAPAGLLIAYTLDGSDPRGPGGQLAAGAGLTPAPLVLTGNATVAVRLYNPSGATFPATPWSALRTLTGTGAGNGSMIANATLPSRLINLSARGNIDSGGVMIAGVIVSGNLPKRFLARAIGPTLAKFKLDAALPDPVLRVLDSNGNEEARNDGWSLGADAAALRGISESVGAFPLDAGSRDAALVVTLAPGPHTLLVSSASGQSGVALAELYALDDNPARLNLSTRSFVRGNEQLLIGGLNIEGDGPRRLLVRAVGPALATYGVPDALPDPALTIYSGPTAIAFNNHWTDPAITDAGNTVGAFALPNGSRDAALIVNLAPGSYTFQVAGRGGASGTALIEVYELP